MNVGFMERLPENHVRQSIACLSMERNQESFKSFWRGTSIGFFLVDAARTTLPHCFGMHFLRLYFYITPYSAFKKSRISL